MTSLLLALDTSTSTASVALFDGHQVLSETTWLAGREHSTRLLTEVRIALERIGRTAHAAQPAELPVRAVIEAGRGRYATALYSQGLLQDEPRLANAEQLAALITVPTIVIGELRAAERAALQTSKNVRLPAAAAGVRRAGFLAELGWRLAQTGVPGDARSLDAVYVT